MKAGTYDDESPAYFVRHYRAMNEQEADALDSFLQWLEWDSETELGPSALHDLKSLVDKYLGRDMPKVERGENEMLDKWIQAIKATGEKP